VLNEATGILEYIPYIKMLDNRLFKMHTTSRKKDLMNKTDNLRSIRYIIVMERRGFVILK